MNAWVGSNSDSSTGQFYSSIQVFDAVSGTMAQQSVNMFVTGPQQLSTEPIFTKISASIDRVVLVAGMITNKTSLVKPYAVTALSDTNGIVALMSLPSDASVSDPGDDDDLPSVGLLLMGWHIHPQKSAVSPYSHASFVLTTTAYSALLRTFIVGGCSKATASLAATRWDITGSVAVPIWASGRAPIDGTVGHVLLMSGITGGISKVFTMGLGANVTVDHVADTRVAPVVVIAGSVTTSSGPIVVGQTSYGMWGRTLYLESKSANVSDAYVVVWLPQSNLVLWATSLGNGRSPVKISAIALNGPLLFVAGSTRCNVFVDMVAIRVADANETVLPFEVSFILQLNAMTGLANAAFVMAVSPSDATVPRVEIKALSANNFSITALGTFNTPYIVFNTANGPLNITNEGETSAPSIDIFWAILPRAWASEDGFSNTPPTVTAAFRVNSGPLDDDVVGAFQVRDKVIIAGSFQGTVDQDDPSTYAGLILDGFVEKTALGWDGFFRGLTHPSLQICNPICATCAGNGDHDCTSCKNGNILQRNGTCMPSCDNIRHYVFVDPTTNVRRCEECHRFCHKCSGPSMHDCIDCPLGFLVNYYFGTRCFSECRSIGYPYRVCPALRVCVRRPQLCPGVTPFPVPEPSISRSPVPTINATSPIPDARCTNGVQDGSETDVDCGGDNEACARCVSGRQCRLDTDCLQLDESGPGIYCAKPAGVCRDERLGIEYYDQRNMSVPNFVEFNLIADDSIRSRIVNAASVWQFLDGIRQGLAIFLAANTADIGVFLVDYHVPRRLNFTGPSSSATILPSARPQLNQTSLTIRLLIPAKQSLSIDAIMDAMNTSPSDALESLSEALFPQITISLPIAWSNVSNPATLGAPLTGIIPDILPPPPKAPVKINVPLVVSLSLLGALIMFFVARFVIDRIKLYRYLAKHPLSHRVPSNEEVFSAVSISLASHVMVAAMSSTTPPNSVTLQQQHGMATHNPAGYFAVQNPQALPSSTGTGEPHQHERRRHKERRRRSKSGGSRASSSSRSVSSHAR
jgi:hypothetical protein